MRSLLIGKRVADQLEFTEGGSHESKAEGQTGCGTDDRVCGGGVDIGRLEA